MAKRTALQDHRFVFAQLHCNAYILLLSVLVRVCPNQFSIVPVPLKFHSLHSYFWASSDFFVGVPLVLWHFVIAPSTLAFTAMQLKSIRCMVFLITLFLSFPLQIFTSLSQHLNFVHHFYWRWRHIISWIPGYIRSNSFDFITAYLFSP